MSFNYRFSGSFTSDSSVARHDVVLPAGEPDFFRIRNRTAWGDDAAETSVEANWWKGMAQDSAQTIDQAVTSGALSSEAITSAGFRFLDTWNPPVFAALATSGTDITNAEPAVATMADTGVISVGDIVRVTDSTAMLQIAGMDFQVSAVSANTNITLQLDASAFAAAATAGNIRLIYPGRFYPRWRYIVPLEDALGISQAAQAIVCTSVNHDFSVGEKVSFRVPSAYGMSEVNNVSATVVSIGVMSEGASYSTAVSASGYNAFRVDLDTSGYTAFAFPTSAAFAAGLSNAIVLPAGSGVIPNANPPAMNINAAFDNRNRYLMRIGTSVLTSASAVYDWEAFYSTLNTAE